MNDKIMRTPRRVQWRRDRIRHTLFHADGPMTTRQIADAIGCSVHTAWGDLANLQGRGAVVSVGNDKERRWALA